MSNIPSLAARVQALTAKMDFWNGWMLWALVFAALAAVGVVITTCLAIVRSKDLAVAQGQLSEAQNRQFALDLAAAKNDAAQAQLKAEDDRLARVQLEDAMAWRRLTPDHRSKMSVSLKRFAKQYAWVLYNNNNVEAFDFGTDIAGALASAGWTATEPEPIEKMTEGPVPLGTHLLLETGIVISSTEDKPSRDASDALLSGISSLGFDVKKSSRAALKLQNPPPTVFVMVEPRPQGPQGDAKIRAQQTQIR